MTLLRCPAADVRLPWSVVTDAGELDRLRPAWADLLARSASNEPMLAPLWLLTWWGVFGNLGGRQLRLVRFADGDRLVGLAPLLRRRHWYRPGIPFRRLEPLGSGEPEADSVCSDYLNVIAERGAEGPVARALAEVLAGGALGTWDELVLPMMDGDGPMPGLLVAAFRDAGLSAETVATGAAPYIPLPSSWEAYVRSLNKKDRYHLLRSLRDFEEWAGGQSTLERATSAAELARGKQVLIDLHRQRWQSADEPGTFRTRRFLAFHDAVMAQLLDEGALELLWLTAHGEPVAAHYSIVWNGKGYFYQCGRKMDLPRNIRPGTVLLAHAIRGAIEAGRREFDFLNGEAVYKKQLAVASRPLVRLRVVRRCLVEHARRLAEGGISCARSVRNAARKAGRWLGRRMGKNGFGANFAGKKGGKLP
jgi:CelD/BcsL family acetyltransferase involved in cellulose biosynthesis